MLVTLWLSDLYLSLGNAGEGPHISAAPLLADRLWSTGTTRRQIESNHGSGLKTTLERDSSAGKS